MSKAVKVVQYSEKTYEHGRLKTEEHDLIYGKERFTQGTVRTEFGMVQAVAYSRWRKRGERLECQRFTRLEIVGFGRIHTREFLHRHYSHRYIVTLAKRFARELHAAGALHTYVS